MSQQLDINERMRAILIDWLIEVDFVHQAVLTLQPSNYFIFLTFSLNAANNICLGFLLQVHMKFELMDETLFLTVNIIDRYLSRHRVMRKHLQLVGVTAMLLACKYEEVFVPVVDDFVLISDNAYTKEEHLQIVRTFLPSIAEEKLGQFIAYVRHKLWASYYRNRSSLNRTYASLK